MRHDTRAVSGHLNGRASTGSVHVEGAFLFGGTAISAITESLTGQALSLIYTPTLADDLGESGLNAFTLSGTQLFPERRSSMAGLGVNNVNGLTPQGAALSVENVQRFLVAPLAAQSIYLSSGVNIIDSASPVRIPTAPNPTENLGYVAEGGTIPEVAPQFGKLTLLPSTMQSTKIIAPFSNELYRQSVVSINDALQTFLVSSVAATVDNNLISGSGDGVTTVQGLLNFPNTQTLAVGGALTVDSIYDAINLALKAFVNESELQLWITPGTLTALRKLKTTAGEYLLQSDPTQAGRSTVAGVPVVVTQRLPTTTGQTPTTQAVLWAPRYTWVVRDASPTVTFLTEAYAKTDEFAIRVTSRYDTACAKPQSIVKLTGITSV